MRFTMPEEKMTDVRIATEMLTDAFNNRFDEALLVSGDSELAPPIHAIRQQFAEKRIIVAFPPKRVSNWLKQAATANFHIGRGSLSKAQLPGVVVRADGHHIRRPDEWH